MELLNTGSQRLNLHLSSKQLYFFESYYHELIDWNQRINITHITEYVEIQYKHFLDALTITLVYKPEDSDYVLDVGTGAGIPGIPLKIVFPNIKLALLESINKKITFLKYITSKLCLENVEIINGRAEEIAHFSQYREKFDVVLSRAVAELPSAVELTLPFCRIGGIFVASKKGKINEELNNSVIAINILGGNIKKIQPVDLPEFSDDRKLVVIEKVSKTPEKYPRRSGIPEKRPIK